MKINGSLVFDASGLSQIENLRIEKLSALPTFGSGDVGRLVYITGAQVLWLGGATSWLSLATGGDAASLAAEVDALEASIGSLVNANGSYNAAALTGTLANSTSLSDLFLKLQSLAATNAAAIADETTRATGIESAIQSELDSEEARAIAEEARIAGLVSAEVTRATSAEGVIAGNLAAEVTARIAGDQTNADAIAAEVTARSDADSALATSVVTERDRALAAELGLGDRITTEVNDRTAAVNVVANNLTAEVTRATGAETALQTAIGNEVTRATTAEQALSAQIQASVTGLYWKNEARVATISNINLSSAPADIDGVTLVNGNRVLVRAQTNPAENGIYVFSAAGNALVRSEDTDSTEERAGYAVFVAEGTVNADTGWTATDGNGTLVQFTGASGITAGAGLSKTGNVVNVGNIDGSITITADNIAVSQSVRDEITANATAIEAEEDRALLAEQGLDQRITDEAAARLAGDNAEKSAREAAVLAEENRAKAAEQANATAVTNEHDRAVAEETRIAGLVTAEHDRAVAEETRIAGLVSAETARATAAETALDTRVTSNEAKLGKLYYLYSGSSAAVHTVTHNLGQKYCNVTVVDADDEVVIPQSVHFNGVNALTVTFNSSIACRVVVMGLA